MDYGNVYSRDVFRKVLTMSTFSKHNYINLNTFIFSKEDDVDPLNDSYKLRFWHIPDFGKRIDRMTFLATTIIVVSQQ